MEATVTRTIRSARLIGRTDELRQFGGALERAAEGNAAILLVGGDAGIGKTRLLDEWGRQAADAGVRVLVGNCLEMGASSLPYAPVVDALRRLVADTPSSRRTEWFGPPSTYSEVAALIPELGARNQSYESLEMVPIDRRQTRLFEQVVGFIERAASRAPMVLAIDDLHWADQSTLDLISYMTSTMDTAGVVLVISYRSDELTRRHPLRPLLSRLERVDGVTSIHLGPLDRGQLAELAEAIHGQPPSAALLDEIQMRSEGNPFFAEELLAATDVSADALPMALQEGLLTRVDRLPDDAQTVLRVAAAAGRDVDHELLALACAEHAGMNEARLLQALREAVSEQVLVVGGDGVGYSFRHALLQEAVHADLLPGERVRLHAIIAETLAARPELAGRAGATAALAWHYAASHDQPRALVASLAAAAAAARSVAHADTLHHLERALELWDGVPDAAERAGMSLQEVLVWAASAAFLDGNNDRAIAYARRAIANIDETADPARAAEAWMLLGRSLFAAGLDGAFDACRRAVDLVPPGPSVERAKVLGAYANALMLIPRMREALEPAEEAVRVAREVESAADELYSLVNLGVVKVDLGDAEQGIAHFVEAQQLARRCGVLDTGKIYVNHSDALFNIGRSDEALEVGRQGLVWAEEHGMTRSFGVWLHANVAEFLAQLGRIDEAAAYLEAARRVSGADLADLHIRLQGARVALARGQMDAAGQALQDAARITHGVGAGAQFVAPRGEASAELALARGEPARALSIVEATLDRVEPADGVRRHGGPLYALGMRAAQLLEPDDREAAMAGLHDRLEVARNDAPWGIGPVWAAFVAMADAEWATFHGDADAGDRWVAAADALDAIHLLPGATRARIRHAELLLSGRRSATGLVEPGSTKGPETREAATELLTRAWRNAADAGLEWLRGEAERIGRRANIPLGPQSSAPFDLTPREFEVLRLVTLGRTNPQIGAELFISRKTASVHVSNILSKLNVRTRGEAAALAHRAGLTLD